MSPSHRFVLGFGSKRRSGKDTSANYAQAFLERLGHVVVREAFAGALKEGIGKGVFGYSDAQLYGDAKEVVDPYWGESPGRSLQRGGEAMRRGYGEDIWVRSLLRRVTDLPPTTSVIITDLRYPNEALAIRYQLAGVLVRCHRPVAIDDGRDPNHESEVALDNFDAWDFVLDNSGNLDELRTQVESMMSFLVDRWEPPVAPRSSATESV